MSPQEDGCWYCYTGEGEMYFSVEFDTYLHLSCLQKKIDLCAKEGWEDKRGIYYG